MSAPNGPRPTGPRPSGLTVIICGGRDFHDRTAVYNVLDKLHATNPFEFVITGGARGADSLADSWAVSCGIPRRAVLADWSIGRHAGAVRNRAMLALAPDLVIAFPGGRGTADMVAQAIHAGIKTFQVEIEEK